MTSHVQADSRPSLVDALGDELLLASRMLGELAFDLGGDEAVLRRHLISLQKIDHVTQMLIIVAELFKKERPDQLCLEAITLDDMAQRLKKRLSEGQPASI